MVYGRLEFCNNVTVSVYILYRKCNIVTVFKLLEHVACVRKCERPPKPRRPPSPGFRKCGRADQTLMFPKHGVSAYPSDPRAVAAQALVPPDSARRC